ncbi:MAG: hypothetical protein O3B95_10715 [Chloroflexi bacterium]|nr:hypothetical protein [Chloroflexota bacterium]
MPDYSLLTGVSAPFVTASIIVYVADRESSATMAPLGISVGMRHVVVYKKTFEFSVVVCPHYAIHIDVAAVDELV